MTTETPPGCEHLDGPYRRLLSEVESLRAAEARAREACAVTCDDPWVADDATETAARILRALDGETEQ